MGASRPASARSDGRTAGENGVVCRVEASLNQEVLWQIHHRTGASPAYNAMWRVGLDAVLEGALLERAWEAVVDRHEALRTRFVQEDRRLLQEVLRGCAPDVRAVAFSADDADSADARVAELLAEPFDLSRSLCRVTLVSFGGRRFELLVCCHHSVVDGASGRVLLEDLALAYSTCAEGGQSHFERGGETPFRVFSQEQRRSLERGELQRSIDHWVAIASGRASTRLAADSEPPVHAGPGGGWIRRRLDAATTAALAALSSEHRTTPFALLLAALQVVLARGGGADGVIGVVAANRVEPRDQEVVGFLANTLPVAISLTPSDTLADAIAGARDTTLDLLEHQRVPFPATFAALDPKTQSYLADGPRILLSYLGLTDLHLEFGPVRGVLLPAVAAAARTDLTLTVQQVGTAWEIGAEFDAGMLHESSIRNLFDDIQLALTVAADAPETVVATLPARTRATAVAGVDGTRIAAHASTAGREVPDDLRGIWCETLNVESAPVEADFFASGGHSLLLVRMLEALAAAGAGEVDVAVWLAEPTLGHLAEVVRAS